jgi:probable phosphoglycerate mutase
LWHRLDREAAHGLMTCMPDPRTRLLYLARHAEPAPDGNLTDAGRRQADLLGRRLAGVPLGRLHHGPLTRARETAKIVAAHLPEVEVHESAAAGDYVPHVPAGDELPPEAAEGVRAFLAGVGEDEAREGAALAASAVEQFTGPGADEADSHTLVVTHAFTVGWLVRHALDAPAWRWCGLDTAHTGLTVIRYEPGRPPAPVVVNDQSHLPSELRWTGFPEDRRV